MRRPLLLLVLALLAAALTPTTAQAASTCTKHVLAIDGWSVQGDYVRGHADFQCGGADQNDYMVDYWLQKQRNDGSWITVDCLNGVHCESVKPSTGFFAAGTEHYWDWTFYPNVQVDCRNWRLQGYASFRSGPISQVWTGPVAFIGGC